MRFVRRKSWKAAIAQRSGARRLGQATIDYILVLSAALPMLAISYYYAMRIIRAVYEMTCTLVCWPFM